MWSCEASFLDGLLTFVRASVYALIAPTSHSMMVGAYFLPGLFHSPPWYFPLAATLKYSNGWMNTLAYALQSRYASRLLGQCEEEHEVPQTRGDVRDVASFSVAFGGVDIQDVLEWDCASSQGGLVVECSSSSELVRRNSSRSSIGIRRAAPEPVVFFEDLYNY